MSPKEYKKFLTYKEADKIVKSIKRGLNEVKEAREGKKILKSAYELAYELWSCVIYDKSEMENVQIAFIEQILQSVSESFK